MWVIAIWCYRGKSLLDVVLSQCQISQFLHVFKESRVEIFLCGDLQAGKPTSVKHPDIYYFSIQTPLPPDNTDGLVLDERAVHQAKAHRFGNCSAKAVLHNLSFLGGHRTVRSHLTSKLELFTVSR